MRLRSGTSHAKVSERRGIDDTRVGIIAAALLLALLVWSGHGASAQQAQDSPLAPVDTSSPRATFQSFRTNVERAYRSWRRHESLNQTEDIAARFLRTLDLAHIGAALRSEVGVDDALYLYDTISRIGVPPPESLPDAAEVAAKGLTRWTLPRTEITIERIAEGPRAGEFLFSSLCAHEDDMREKPEMLQAFMNGIAHSYKFVRSERQQTLEIAKKWFPQLDVNVLETAFDRFIKEKVYPERTLISETAWKANFNEFLPFVNYPLKLPVDMAAVTNLEFAKKADAKFGLS